MDTMKENVEESGVTMEYTEDGKSAGRRLSVELHAGIHIKKKRRVYTF